MMKRVSAIAAAIIASGLIGAPVALAQSQTDQMPKSEAPAMSPNGMPDMKQGMMPDMKQGGDMMGMMTMMSQMQAMMEACTKMMQAMTPGEGMQGDTAPGSSG